MKSAVLATSQLLMSSPTAKPSRTSPCRASHVRHAGRTNDSVLRLSCRRAALTCEFDCSTSSAKPATLASAAAVVVLQAHDVVFTHVVAALHLDQDQLDLARVLQAVAVAGGDIRRLVGVDQALALVVGDLRGAFDDYPVLASMVMHLQRQARSGLDHDALDLEAGAFLERRVRTPRARHGA